MLINKVCFVSQNQHRYLFAKMILKHSQPFLSLSKCFKFRNIENYNCGFWKVKKIGDDTLVALLACSVPQLQWKWLRLIFDLFVEHICSYCSCCCACKLLMDVSDQNGAFSDWEHADYDYFDRFGLLLVLWRHYSGNLRHFLYSYYNIIIILLTLVTN